MSLFAEFLAPVTSYPLGTHLTEYPGVTAEVERMVPMGGSSHYVWVRGESRREFVADLREDTAVGDVTTVEDLPDRSLVRFEWSSLASPVFELIEERSVTITGVHGSGEGWTIRLRFPGDETLSAFTEACRERGITMELRGTFEPDGVEDGTDELTDTQAETLAVAFEAGYFDVPRGITLAELAEELGVSEQAVSERLRRGLSSLLTATVLGDDPDDDDAEPDG